MVGSQPSFSIINLLLELRPRTPIGPSMCLMGSFLSSNDKAICANSIISTISVEPKLIGTSQSENVKRNTPSTQSSMKVKDRVCLPSPHISNSVVLVMALRQKAAGAFSRPPFQVPRGP